MIDLTLLRRKTEETKARLYRKDPSFDSQKLLDLDQSLRNLRIAIEQLQHRKNLIVAQGAQGNALANREQSKLLSEEIKEKERSLLAVEATFQDMYLRCPNLPADDVPEGDKSANQVISTWSSPKTFSFIPKNHMELNQLVQWFDMGIAATMTGSNFVWYNTMGTKLLYSLALFMLNNNIRHGYAPVLPPYLINEEALVGVGQFPLFKQAVYAVPEDGMYLIPTSEASLTNLYRDRIFFADELPVRLTSWTSCFRREAGGYGAMERGLIRIHQFEKVELYTITTPEQATQEHERMLACAESILQQLNLHYRVSLLAGQDCSFSSAKTYDIEVWMPGQKMYYEVSSTSNCTDFQARRCSIRYRAEPGAKTNLVHTLNGSSLALPRLMVALMENYQQEDGSIAIPSVLQSVTFSL